MLQACVENENKKQELAPQRTAYLKESAKKTLIRIVQALIREELIPFSLQDHNLIFSLSPSRGEIHVKNIKLTLLLRCINFENMIFVDDGKIDSINDSKALLNYLHPLIKMRVSENMWERFFHEIQNHEKNAAASAENSAFKNHHIQQTANATNCRDMVTWLNMNLAVTDKSLYMEQFVSGGHPIHPCSKTKFGFSEIDVIKFSPEFNPVIRLIISAVKNTMVDVTLSNTIKENYLGWFANHFPSEYANWKNTLIQHCYSIDEYVPVILHPWQESVIIQRKFKSLIDSRLITIFDNVYIEASPTLSLRTLKPIKNPHAPYIKLPISIQATSVFRTLPPISVKNAPLVSDFLEEIFKKENNFDGKLKILPERCGVHLCNVPHDDAKHLGVIFRESIDNYVESDEICLVVAALFEKSPISGLPILIEQMKISGVDNSNKAYAYFSKYAETIISSYLDLYLIYGISLEGHQQNTLAIFKEGRLSHFIARDFDGIDIDEPIFRKIQPIEIPESLNHVLSASSDVPRRSLLHTVFQSHLGEIIILLVRYYQCRESELWNIVSHLTHQRFIFLENRIDNVRWKIEYEAILKGKWNCKALLRMRLVEEYHRDGLFSAITNPLTSFIQSADHHVK